MIPSHLNVKPRASVADLKAASVASLEKPPVSLLGPSMLAPAYFKPARPMVANIVSYKPPPSKSTPSQAAGLRYEKKWHEFAANHYGTSYQTFEDRQIAFSDEVYGWRTCRPDGLFWDEGRRQLLIFEVKIRHTADAYWQLEKLYKPVLSHFYIGIDKVLIEVTKSFDPSTPFPCEYHLMHGSEFMLGDTFKADKFNVLIWT